MIERQQARSITTGKTTQYVHTHHTRNNRRSCIRSNQINIENTLENIIPHASYWQVLSHRCAVGEERRKASLNTHLPLLSLMLEGLGRRGATVIIFTSAFSFSSSFDAFFGGNTLPFCIRFHPFLQEILQKPQMEATQFLQSAIDPH